MKSVPIILFASLVSISCVQSAPVSASGAGARAATAQPGAVQPATIRPIDYAALKAALEATGSAVILLDVRTAEEFKEGRIPSAVLAPYDALSASFAEPDKNRPIVVYCRSGRRSAIAAETLAGMGYTNLADFGSIDNWKGSLQR